MNWLVFFTLLSFVGLLFGAFTYRESIDGQEVGVMLMLASAVTLCICGGVYF